MSEERLDAFVEKFSHRLATKRGHSGGYPSCFNYAARALADGRVELELRDAGSESDVWRKPDTWGCAILSEMKEKAGERGLEFPPRLRIAMRQPSGEEKPHFEALRRRLSYLAAVNPALEIALSAGEAEAGLLSRGQLAKPAKNELIRRDYNERDDKDKPGRLEKDFQAYLYGKGLHDDEDGGGGERERSSLRLSLLGRDFLTSRHASCKLDREFPTGVFLDRIAKETRLLPTWYVDLLTMNVHGQIAAVELKFHSSKNRPGLDVVAQVLDYALFFHSYRRQLRAVLRDRIGCPDDGERETATYLVSNMFHSRFRQVWPWYAGGDLAMKVIQTGFMWE